MVRPDNRPKVKRVHTNAHVLQPMRCSLEHILVQFAAIVVEDNLRPLSLREVPVEDSVQVIRTFLSRHDMKSVEHLMRTDYCKNAIRPPRIWNNAYVMSTFCIVSCMIALPLVVFQQRKMRPCTRKATSGPKRVERNFFIRRVSNFTRLHRFLRQSK